LLFAGEEELPDAVQPVLDEAVLEVQQALKDGADEDDARLNQIKSRISPCVPARMPSLHSLAICLARSPA